MVTELNRTSLRFVDLVNFLFQLCYWNASRTESAEST